MSFYNKYTQAYIIDVRRLHFVIATYTGPCWEPAHIPELSYMEKHFFHFFHETTAG